MSFRLPLLVAVGIAVLHDRAGKTPPPQPTKDTPTITVAAPIERTIGTTPSHASSLASNTTASRRTTVHHVSQPGSAPVSDPPAGIYVQVDLTDSEQEATRIATKLETIGIRPLVQPGMSEHSEPVFRIMTGPLSKTNAAALEQRFMQQGFSRSFIKTISPKKAVADE